MKTFEKDVLNAVDEMPEFVRVSVKKDVLNAAIATALIIDKINEVVNVINKLVEVNNDHI